MQQARNDILSCRGLVVNFGGVQALRSVDFAVETGSITALIGPNGAGKTTLLNVVSGLVNADQGTVKFREQDITSLPPHKRAVSGVVRTFQNLEIFYNMSVLENVMTGCHRRIRYSVVDSLLKTPRYWGGEKRCYRYAERELEFVNLMDKKDTPATELPFGSQRLLELARAVASEPTLLLLDEPAAGLNIRETGNLGKLIRRIRDERGITVVLVEHDMDLVMRISDSVTVLNFGEVIAQDVPLEIQKNPQVIAAYLGEDEDT
ncbi:MAG: ABC transporter ATP-binding protein [Deltaproteobacteria bacterium]|nr:ABC transporter ATP-binding protein [Deltaproteobacteria bacterium]